MNRARRLNLSLIFTIGYWFRHEGKPMTCKVASILRSIDMEAETWSPWGRRLVPMIKALFTMILLSNDHAARLVERFQRLRV